MKNQSLALTASLAIASFLIGSAFGYFVSPTYQQTMFERNTMDLGVADRWVDLRYLNAMAAHHRGAILLADQVDEKFARPEIKSLASEIKQNEPKLIAELYAWKKKWYGDGSQVRDPIVARLGSADANSDLRLLNALIAHHEAGILMTKEIRLKSSNAEVLSNADAVEQFLSGSSVTLKAWRADWYKIQP